jgi:thiol-disulfide isomerase/thioredoxin
MPSARRWAARGLDVLAGLIVLFALFEFFVAPRLAAGRIVPAPPVSLSTLDGGRFSIDGQKGRLTYLDFWATWCEPCQRSIPLIQRFARAHPEVDVVSVDVGEPTHVVRSFVKRFPMEKVALDPDETAAHAFGVANFPTMIVIDRRGNQRAKWLGYNPDVEAQMAAMEASLAPKKTALIGRRRPEFPEHDQEHAVRLAARAAHSGLPVPSERARVARSRSRPRTTNAR